MTRTAYTLETRAFWEMNPSHDVAGRHPHQKISVGEIETSKLAWKRAFSLSALQSIFVPSVHISLHFSQATVPFKIRTFADLHWTGTEPRTPKRHPSNTKPTRSHLRNFHLGLLPSGTWKPLHPTIRLLKYVSMTVVPMTIAYQLPWQHNSWNFQRTQENQDAYDLQGKFWLERPISDFNNKRTWEQTFKIKHTTVYGTTFLLC